MSSFILAVRTKLEDLAVASIGSPHIVVVDRCTAIG